jgi:Asp-tRNA(Asn)/Glu-tRNA(Gln) amidotransferase B subunit
MEQERNATDKLDSTGVKGGGASIEEQEAIKKAQAQVREVFAAVQQQLTSEATRAAALGKLSPAEQSTVQQVIELDRAFQAGDTQRVRELTKQVEQTAPATAAQVQASGLLTAGQGQLLGQAIEKVAKAAHQEAQRATTRSRDRGGMEFDM